MIFYRVEADVKESIELEEDEDRLARQLAENVYLFYQRQQKQACVFVSNIRAGTVILGCIVKDKQPIDELLASYFALNTLDAKVNVAEEVTFKSLRDMLYSADRNCYVRDDDEVLRLFNLDRLDRSGLNIDEAIYGEVLTKKELLKNAQLLTCEATLRPEIDRIFAGKKRSGVVGHPVHYLAVSDDVQLREDMVKMLHNALYSNGRLESRRACILTFFGRGHFSRQALDNLYKSCEGGMVYLKLLMNDDDDSDVKRGDSEFLYAICEIMRKHQNRVLTVFGMRRACGKLRDELMQNLGNTTLIELNEELLCGDKVRLYLKGLAKSVGVKGDKRLYAFINDEQKGYLASELSKQFDYWYNNKLKTDIYPQYSALASVSAQISEEKPRGSAYNELQEMIGLTEAKAVILQALDYFKAQKLFRDKGMQQEQPAMHMVFTGNPGTAKTSVARLFAQIMKENGLLSRGQLYEVGRADIVGQYVGQTAPLVKRAFQEAAGSVLFIDEAYSLVDDRDGLYGDEAINAIVQEMENRREDMVVIFAGYPDKMQRFLDKNPGLRSRIAFHIPFADYSPDELLSIAELMAKKRGLVFDESCRDKLTELFEGAEKEADFGNGRYVRNILERARMKQASRLVRMAFDEVTERDISTITAEDIEAPACKNEAQRLGF